MRYLLIVDNVQLQYLKMLQQFKVFDVKENPKVLFHPHNLSFIVFTKANVVNIHPQELR